MRTLLLSIALVRLCTAQSVDVSKVDALAEAALKAWNAPGIAVAIIQDDHVIMSKGYGVKEHGKPDPVTSHTVFAIGSMSKAFTTASMAMLVDEGKMSWDDPVRKHIEFFRLADPLASEQVTLRDLVCHRTGLNRNDVLWTNSSLSQEEIIRRIGYVKANKPFRAAWQYNNIMVSAAGFAVGKASGGTWQQFVKSRIFEPLGMKTASTDVAAAQAAPDHSSPHRRTQVVPWRNLDNIAPAGAVNASLDDLIPWARLQLNGGQIDGKRLISAENVEEMHTPQMAMRPEDQGRDWNPELGQISYGLGWFILDYRGLHLVGHGGAIDGFRSDMTLIPREKTAVIILSNLDQDNLPEALRWSILDLMHGFPQRDWNAALIGQAQEEQKAADAARKRRAAQHVTGTSPSHPLADYSGTYWDPGYGEVKIAVESGALALAWLNVHTALEHYHYDTFDPKERRGGGSQVVFRLNGNGSVSGLNFMGIDFVRR
jgi:CubicO group peptidase (beta-lactamase class C family)